MSAAIWTRNHLPPTAWHHAPAHHAPGRPRELFFTKDGEDKRIPFGFRQYAEGNFPEDGYWGDTISVPAGRPYRCFAAAGWTEPRKLVIRVNIADDYFGNLTITLAFKGSQIALHMIKAAEWFLDGYQGYAGGELADPR